jgi:hypothetical protein
MTVLGVSVFSVWEWQVNCEDFGGGERE